MKTMKANVFHGENDIRVEKVERPCAGVGDAVIRVTLTTICGTDLHILRGDSLDKIHDAYDGDQALAWRYLIKDFFVAQAFTPGNEGRGLFQKPH